MLGILAAVALVVGAVSSTIAVSQDGQPTAAKDRAPVVNVQPVQPVDAFSTDRAR